MTQPPIVDPNAPPATAAQLRATSDAFAQKLMLATYQDFGPEFRPGYAAALASGAASADDIETISSFVRALDTAKQATANKNAGVAVEHSASSRDLLNSVGENSLIVDRANSTAQNTKDPATTANWFDNVGHTVAGYAANSGDLIFPQTKSFAGGTSTGAAENPITHGLKVTLNTIGNFAGWLFRSQSEDSAKTAVGIAHLVGGDDAAQKAAQKLGLTQLASAQKALGYDPNNPLSDLAFQWNHGEATFNDLTGVVQTYGQDHVNAALNVFYRMKGYGADYKSALGNYLVDLQQQVRDGKMTVDQYTKQQSFLDSPEFQDVYKAVDMQHKSFGRDVAHLILPHQAYDDPNNATLFNVLSGIGDAAFTLVADPTIVGGKLIHTAQLARYAVDATNATRVSRVLGVADKVTGEANSATGIGKRAQAFLDSAKQVRDATAAGNHVEAAAQHAYMSRAYNDMMPMLTEVNGDRMAITPAQIAASREAGTSAMINGALVPVIKSAPIETLDQMRDFLVAEGGLYRYGKGAGAGTLRLMPGKVGPIAKVLSSAAGNRAAARVTAKADVVLDYTKDLDKITPSDWSALFQQIAQARGTAQFDALQGQLGTARRIKAATEQMNRRITSLLPVAKSIAFNSADAGSDIERLARLSLPKYESSILRYIWDTNPTEATRRAIGRGIVNAVNEAAGTTRSVVGRNATDAWTEKMNMLDNRRYGHGETDRLPMADGSIGRGALHMSQIETHLEIPKFEDLRRTAAKAAIFGYDRRLADGTLGEGMAGWLTDAAGERDVAGGLARVAIHPWRTAKYALFFSKPVERTMAVMKIGWLLTSANMWRQMAEEYLGIGAAGNRTKLVAGKRYLRIDNDTNRFIIKAHNLIPRVRRANVVTEQDAAREITQSRYQVAVGDGELSDAEKQAISELADIHTHPEVAEMYAARQAGQADGLDVAIAGHASGVQHTHIGWQVTGPPARFKGYTEAEMNGDSGRAALSDEYGQRFHNEDEPALRALAWHMWHHASENPAFYAALKAEPGVLDKMQELVPTQLTKAGKIKPPSMDAIRDYVSTDARTAVFRQRAEVLNTDPHTGRPIAPADEATRAEATDWYVHNLLGDVAASVYRADGKTMHAPLVSDLLRSKIPSPSDLSKISLTNLPSHVIRAEFEPAPIGAIGKFGQGFTKLMSRAFDKVVTEPMGRLIRKPLFTANYVQARVSLGPWEKQLVDEFGWQAEDAQKLVSSLAEGQAIQDTIRYIDNPAVRSQFSVIAQNVWLFYRAQEDWARRWVRVLRENPEAIRKAHMAIMAANNIGMVDKDSDGKLIFSYPGSGLALEAMMHVGNLFTGKPGATVPHVDDLTSQVNFLNPALMNPIGFSATPALSVPFDLLSKFIPGGDMLKASADLAMQGQLGNGRQWWEQFMPTAIRRIIQVSSIDGNADNTHSTVGSASAAALQNAALLGQLPDGSDAIKMQEAITNVQAQTLNALIARSLFAFFAPGAPSMPELYGQEPADFSWRAAGVRTLSDEFKAMTQSLGYANALVAWQELHPDKMILATGKTVAGAKGAAVDPTYGSAQWVAANKELFDGPYKRVAAYFIPPAPGNFDQQGWNMMTAIGVRQYKDLTTYYTDIMSVGATRAWFDAKDDYDAAHAAIRSGDMASLERQWTKEGLTDARKQQLRQVFSDARNSPLTTSALDDMYTQKKNDLYAQYPILRPYFNETASRKDATRQMVNELTQMVQDPTVNLPDLPGVAQMLIVKDNYEKQLAAIKAQRSTLATATRQDLTNSYQDELQSIVTKYPNLRDLYNGVFRFLEG